MRRVPATPRRTQSSSAGFDITAQLRRVCDDMVARLDVLAHINMDQVAVAFAQARKRVPHGMQASLTPMRFEGGCRTGLRGGRSYAVQPLFGDRGQEVLYILTVYLPRFMDLCFREKLVTVLHELWHVSPNFDGDIRRHAGRCYVHSRSQNDYDAAMGRLADHWLDAQPPESLFAFLKLNFDQLRREQGRVVGVRVAQPRLIATRPSD